MKRFPMVSIAAHLYAGRRLKAGDPFTARGAGDYKLLQALKRAEPAKPVIAPPEPEPLPVPRKRVYRRKDVVTELPVEVKTPRPFFPPALVAEDDGAPD